MNYTVRKYYKSILDLRSNSRSTYYCFLCACMRVCVRAQVQAVVSDDTAVIKGIDVLGGVCQQPRATPTPSS